MNRRENLHMIAQQARSHELVFPTSATVALRIERELEDPDCSVEALARLVKAEPLLAARLVAIANSAAFNRSQRSITDIRAALTLLGMRTLRAVVTAVVARQLAGTPATAEQRKVATQLWEHSAHVAAMAQLLARRVTKLDGETALFAGLIHEIAGFYLISRASEFPGLLQGEPSDWMGDDSGEDDDMGDDEAPEHVIGRAVLTTLQVPEAVITAVEHMWNGYLAYPPVGLGDTLLLADQLAAVPSPLEQPATNVTIDATPHIDMLVDRDTLHAIIEESAADVKSLAQALSS